MSAIKALGVAWAISLTIMLAAIVAKDRKMIKSSYKLMRVCGMGRIKAFVFCAARYAIGLFY